MTLADTSGDYDAETYCINNSPTESTANADTVEGGKFQGGSGEILRKLTSMGVACDV